MYSWMETYRELEKACRSVHLACVRSARRGREEGFQCSEDCPLQVHTYTLDHSIFCFLLISSGGKKKRKNDSLSKTAHIPDILDLELGPETLVSSVRLRR